MLDAAIAREEIKDEVLTPFYEEMHELTEEEKKEEAKREEEKKEAIDKAGPLTFKKAKECVLRYAVSIRMIPTRLKTALKEYKDKFT